MPNSYKYRWNSKSWDKLYLLNIKMWMMPSKVELNCLRNLSISLALKLDYSRLKLDY